MAYVILCGVPKDECCGAEVTFEGPTRVKAHGDRMQAFRCMVKYLERQGYKRVGQRDFKAPDGTRRIISKKTHFGFRAYYTKEKARFMRPNGRRGQII